MRQAIEEGFILDVLRNYITYQARWRLANAAVEAAETADPEVDPRKAKAKLVRAAELHPTSQDQRAQIIVDHFRSEVRDRLGGRAKAMAVTRSREHAVLLYQAIQRYIGKRDLHDCATLVAFSGTLEVDKIDYTEPKLNGFSEGALPGRFAYAKIDDPQAVARNQTEYRILVVAEKYQTGFDQPLLTAMYVDKPLTGVAAVQTLSRLNRTNKHTSQEDVFVLDFTNEAEDIQAAFKPYFETTITEPTDPNLLYDKQREVMDYQLLIASEMQAFAEELLAAQGRAVSEAQVRKAHAELYRFTAPAVDRFVALSQSDPDHAEEFRSSLSDYVRAYGFLAQIVGYADPELERLYLYGRFLLLRLPRTPGAGVDIGDATLSHFRLDRTGGGDFRLAPEGEQVVPGFRADGGDTAAAVVQFRPEARTAMGDLVALLLDELDRAAVALFPHWLSGAERLDGPQGLGLAAVRALAAECAARSRNFGPFLTDLAERSLLGEPGGPSRFPAGVRAAGLARVIADAYHRESAALLVVVPDRLSPVDERALVAAVEWFAQYGRFTVWLAGAPFQHVDHVRSVAVALPGYLTQLAAEAEQVDVESAGGGSAETLRYPPLSGLPRRDSPAEQALERALASCEWARGREWNRSFEWHVLAKPYRLDLFWASDGLVVEVDGPDHRGRLKFADDRHRDVQLQLLGHDVLRFTNEQVLSDVTAVVARIEKLLGRLRADPYHTEKRQNVGC
jgi:very-short-patch-repair endonuclease